MHHLNVEKPVLSGWSMGASVIFSYLDHYTDEGVAGVVVVDQTPKIVSDETWAFGALGIDAAGVEQTAAAIRADYAGFLSGFIPSMFAGGVSDEDLQRYSAIAQLLGADYAAALLKDHALRDWRDVVARFKKPLLAVSGAQYAAANGAAGIRSLLPHAQTAVFQESAHCCFLEEADKFEMLLDEFISGIERQHS